MPTDHCSFNLNWPWKETSIFTIKDVLKRLIHHQAPEVVTAAAINKNNQTSVSHPLRLRDHGRGGRKTHKNRNVV